MTMRRRTIRGIHRALLELHSGANVRLKVVSRAAIGRALGEPKDRPQGAAIYSRKEGRVVYIARDLSYEGQLDALIHEWAHHLAPHNDSEDHDDAWGVAYARLYRKVNG